MGKNIFIKIIISIVLLSIFIFITIYSDSSLNEDFDEAAIMSSYASQDK